jgi:WD40 repeat protein
VGAPALAELTVTVWEVATGKVRRTHPFKCGDCRGLGLSPDGNAIAVASSDGTLKVWDVATGKVRATFRMRQAPTPLGGPWAHLVFSPDGKFLASRGGCEEAVTVWDLTTRQGQVIAPNTKGWPMILTFAADGRSLAVSYYGGTVRRWALRACPPPARPRPPGGGGA